MPGSSKWYKAAGFSIVAAAVTARYVAKWRKSQELKQAALGSDRSAVKPRYYIGLDLTDPTIATQRPCDVAVIHPDDTCEFSQWVYNESGSSIIPDTALGKSFILAIDGPQGLAGEHEATARLAESAIQKSTGVGVPGRTPYDFPLSTKPYAGLISGSVKLFYRLTTSGGRFRLLGMAGAASDEANLMEVFPGAAWRAITGEFLPPKRNREGRELRMALLQELGVKLQTKDLPTTDQLDAAMAAWTARCFNYGDYNIHGQPPWVDEDLDVIREGYIVQPSARIPEPGALPEN